MSRWILSDPPRHIQKIITLAALLHADQVIDRIIRLSGDPDGTASLRACRDWGELWQLTLVVSDCTLRNKIDARVEPRTTLPAPQGSRGCFQNLG
jgi:hypothetical protein